MKKTGFNHALQDYAGMTLKPAKDTVDAVLERRTVNVQVEADKVNEFLQLLEELGVNAKADTEN